MRTLDKQIDAAAARYGQTKDPAAREEVDRLSRRLAEFRHLATLENALDRCRAEDMRKPEVEAALNELAKVMTEPWPIRQFAAALVPDNEEGRWQIANAAFNGIKNFVTR